MAALFNFRRWLMSDVMMSDVSANYFLMLTFDFFRSSKKRGLIIDQAQY